MTKEQIQSLFWETIERKQPYGKAIYNVVSGVTKDTLYNWTKKRGPEPTIGDMLGVLFEMNVIGVWDQTSDSPERDLQVAILQNKIFKE